MGQITHNISNSNDGFGDALREAFDHQNTMNTELYDTKVDEIAGKGLSENDFTNALKDKLVNIDTDAQINVQADWLQEDDTQDNFIKNKPDYINAIGSITYADVATQTTPLIGVANVELKLLNDINGTGTDFSNAPYGIGNFWDSTPNELDFAQLSIGDTVNLRTTLKVTTSTANQNVNVYARLGLDTASEIDLLIGSKFVETAGEFTFESELSFVILKPEHITAMGELYLISEHNSTVKVQDFRFITIRKNINIIDIDGLTDLSATRTSTNVTIESSTGTPALIGLGDGTLAGFSLNNYSSAEKAKLADTYIKSEVDAKLVSLYKFKGNVANYASLPSSGQVIGDVWNLTDTGGNYAWTGTVWDELGTSVDISGKVDKNTAITGATKTKITYDSKGLVTNGADLIESDIPTLGQSKITNLTTDLALKAPLASPTFTGSVVVPNATLSTQAVNKGQLDTVNAKVSQYNTYFINTATGNNATGVFEDTSKPFATIDYVNANFTLTQGAIFYLQGTGQTYVMNGQFQSFNQSIVSDENSTNILDFSSNANAFAKNSGALALITVNMPNGVIRNERSGGTGIIFSLGSGRNINTNFNVKEIYWNCSTNMTQSTSLANKLQADKISSRIQLCQGISNDIIIQEFVCLATGATLAQFGKNTTINLISGTGSYILCDSNGSGSPKHIITDVTATGGLTWGGFGEIDVTFNNSTITTFNLQGNSSLKTIRGNIKSITTISGSINSTKFINFTANLGAGNMTLGTSNATVSFENCSIKSTNSPIIITAGAFSNVLELKNCAFEVVNAVPLVTGGAGGTNTLKIAGVSTNATMLSDQNGTGVTVTQFTNY